VALAFRLSLRRHREVHNSGRTRPELASIHTASSDYYFKPLQRRLDAEDVKIIMAVMKQEVFDYVRKIEAENSTLEEIHSELSDLLAKRDRHVS